MIEPLLLNRSPLNQTCKQVLLQLAPDEADPYYLYSLQLAIWRLAKKQMGGPSAEYQHNLLEQAEIMLGWKPENVQDWLMPEPEAGGWQLGEDWLRDSPDPEEIAARLTTQLSENLQQEFPNLGPPTEQWERTHVRPLHPPNAPDHPGQAIRC